MMTALALAAPASAQETQTEREAAKDVLQKMASLEASLDVPAMMARLATTNARRDGVAARAKQLMETELLALSDDICTHPEVGYKETRSVEKLAEALRKHDFSVEIGVGGFDTAFLARFRGGSGRPNMGVIVEYDALRGTNGAFHGDQHSTVMDLASTRRGPGTQAKVLAWYDNEAGYSARVVDICKLIAHHNDLGKAAKQAEAAGDGAQAPASANGGAAKVPATAS